MQFIRIKSFPCIYCKKKFTFKFLNIFNLAKNTDNWSFQVHLKNTSYNKSNLLPVSVCMKWDTSRQKFYCFTEECIHYLNTLGIFTIYSLAKTRDWSNTSTVFKIDPSFYSVDKCQGFGKSWPEKASFWFW